MSRARVVVSDYIEPGLDWEAAELAKRDIEFIAYQLKFAPKEELIAAGTTTYTYDYENRLRTVTLPAPATTTFTYNGEGQRLTKVDSLGTIKYLYDQAKVAIERDGSNNSVATYTHEGGSLYHDLISMERTNSYYYLFDGLGSVTELMDSWYPYPF